MSESWQMFTFFSMGGIDRLVRGELTSMTLSSWLSHNLYARDVKSTTFGLHAEYGYVRGLP